MAYDPNDPADKATVQALIDEAVEAERETHAAEVTRLTNKNNELLGKLRKARTGEADTGEVERIERELEETGRKLTAAESALREANRNLTKVTGERDTAVQERDSEVAFSRNTLIENDLTAALVAANVQPHFMDAARALLGKGVTVEVEGDTRKTVANGKTVAEYVKEWAASDAGKHYVQAPANGGGGANNANGGGGGGKKLAEMSEQERLEMSRTNPAGWAALLAAEGSGNNEIAA